MEEKIVFIDNSGSFIVRSIVNNLEENGCPCLSIGWSLDEMKENKEMFTNIVIGYIEELTDVDPKAFIFLRDLCVEGNCGLYLIGYKDDIEMAKKNYFINAIAGEFERPVNAKEVAEKIGDLMINNPLKYKKHILVVDDSGVMLNTIQDWLGFKYRVSVVNSAMNAITFLGKSIPDLILLDYDMPGCSGAQLLEMLRTNIRTEDIPVMFLTGKDDPQSVRSVLGLKPVGYLLKNMPRDYIVNQVNDFFERQKNI